ncbi:Aste57867_12505 [Aphanomyces stellatus]|uniref:Aste57867_12505 protein n=1 Tax=Aphanomyces stellatus TaxID=120398 RepID=A0A485KVR0_9STRA|nr:hypothetical protein As57867_012459 [Aphanomyces stellatus]VFT89356.1 Aste57867_12505 [Aphanomyces stellatus]
MLARLVRRVRVPSATTPLFHAAPFSSDVTNNRFHDILQDIHVTVESKKKPSVKKLTALFRCVTSRQDLVEATKALRVYETNFVDPEQKTAGEFVKASIEQDAADVALKVFQQHHRIGMFVKAGSFNSLLLAFHKKRDHASALTLFKQMKMYRVEPTGDTYTLVFKNLLAAGDFDQCLDLLKVAAETKKLKTDGLNHVLIQLLRADQVDHVATVKDIAIKHEVPQNATTKTLFETKE